MAADKAPGVVNGAKHARRHNSPPADVADGRPAKKAKLLDASDDNSSDDQGVALKINQDYARRFEHNKKREEKQRLEEKYADDDNDSEEDSEDGVEEDDDGEFATEALDAEISATLHAIRSKDPRVYDKNVTFYRPATEDEVADADEGKLKEPSMTLRQYHTKNLLGGGPDGDDEGGAEMKTYTQEQAETREKAIKEIYAAAGSEDEEDDFLVTKSRPIPSNKQIKITEQDIEDADKDPETYLSNFMAARAWVPTAGSHWKPLESDDEEEEERAEAYEDAYNMYFEDPAGTNDKIVTYARDAVASSTVRRDEKSSRRKAREAAHAKREAEKKNREEELARLRNLKKEDLHRRVRQIRNTAGLNGQNFKVDEWTTLLKADWSDDEWDKMMQERFGKAYYAKEYGHSSDEESDDRKKPKPQKPKFKGGDIEINDIVPDFDDGGYRHEKAKLALSSDGEDEEDNEHGPSKFPKQRKQERADAKSAARRDHRIIESLVDSSLEYESALAKSSKMRGRFRYRETSPTSFGLTPRDILLADDAQLNEYAGLKKLAAFRDPTKKKKDKKHLSKKARLRQWRLDTFGDENPPDGGLDVPLGGDADKGDGKDARDDEKGGIDIREAGGKKKKRNRKRKREAAAGQTEA